MQAPEIPVVLGPLGTYLLVFYSAAATLASVWLVWKTREASHWRGAAQALESELGIMRGRSDRLHGENAKLAEENARLLAATDLTVLTKENQEEHMKIIAALSNVELAVKDNTRALLGFQSQNASAFENISVSLQHVAGSLKAVEARLSGK